MSIAKKQKTSDFEQHLIFQQEEEQLNGQGTALIQNWKRPDLPPDWNSKDIAFQQIDLEESTSLDGAAIVRVFGVTNEGHSVLCNITGFKHYFYVPCPVGFVKDDLDGLSNHLSESFGSSFSHLELHLKESIWGYTGGKKSPFIKVVVNIPNKIHQIRNAFENGNVSYRGYFVEPLTSFDNLSYEMRVMVDESIAGMAWMTLPKGKYIEITSRQKISNCQIEVNIDHKDLVAHSSEGEWLKIAPLRILSFDIECAGRKGTFPDAKIDPVIQIANVVQTFGTTKPFVKNVFTLNTCAAIAGVEVLSFSNEADLLLKWRDFVKAVDPDLIIGYNTANFDFPYLLDRADALKIGDKFPYFSRIPNSRQVVKDSTFSSKAYGTRESKVVNIDGRLQMDMLQYITREHKLRSYSLNSVCAHFLGEQKEDVHHSIITELQNGTSESRRRLAVYCLKDAWLPLRLLEKLMCFVNYIEMARVTGVPFSYLLSRGQQIKVISQLYRKCLSSDHLIPNMRSQGSSEEQYEGATVIEPVRGYYKQPIATLDFASLYPSIMMAHNLCYTTLVSKETIKALDLQEDLDYTRAPTGNLFVKDNKCKGLLPVILEELLAARKRAKADLKKETDPFKKAVLDGRQLALKISANSVYGFTGATVGKLPCLEISSSVTAFGREMIEKTKNEVENRYTIKNNYKHDAQVVYGDTDSVMVKFGTDDLAEAMKLGEEAANYVTTKFIKPIKLEFEKVYYPYLLINKKRYAGLYWTNTEKYDKMDTKGIETVRRDNCRLVQSVIDTVLKLILMDRDEVKAQEYVKMIIADLLQNKVDMSQLVITKQLSRLDYAGKQAHVELAERMRQRDAGSAPTVGDRVAYVIIKGRPGGKAYENSEDPLYVLENNIPIDTKYYLENQLSNPLLRIFEPILGNEQAKSLLHGAHTKKITVVAPTTGGLMSFVVKREVCKSCRKPLKSGAALCDDCIKEGKAFSFYEQELINVNEAEEKYARLWTQCQRCQDILHQDVLCAAKDCPIFYMRTKAQKEASKAYHELSRFDLCAW